MTRLYLRLAILLVGLIVALVRRYGGAPSPSAAEPLAASAAEAPAAPAAAFTLPCPADRVGRVVHMVQDVSGSVRGMAHVNGHVAGVHVVSVKGRLDLRAETVEAANGQTVRVRATFLEKSFSSSLVDGKLKHDPVEGKTYLVGVDGSVASETGKPVSAVEEQIARRAFPLGARAVARRALCDVPLTVGQRIELPPDDMAVLGPYKSLAYVFRGVRGGQAVFDTSASLEKIVDDQKGFTVVDKLDIDGAAIFDARTGEQLRLEGDGPLHETFEMQQKGRRLSASGAGKAHVLIERKIDG